MEEKKGKAVHIDIWDEPKSYESGNGVIIPPSGTGRSLLGAALDLIDKNGSILKSSLQRDLKVSFSQAEEIINGLLLLNAIQKHPENYSYIRKQEFH